MIIQTDSEFVDCIVQTSYVHDRAVVATGQCSCVGAEVVVIIFELRAPIAAEGVFQAGARGPASPNRARAGIDGGPPKRRESIVGFFFCPGRTACCKNEPAISETVTKSSGS